MNIFLNSFKITLGLIIYLNSSLSQEDLLRFRKIKLPADTEIGTIDCIYQDRLGFIWIGTYAGLYKYDGYQLKHYDYNPQDSFSIGDNKVTCITEDWKGNLWLGTQGGLFRMDPFTEIFHRYYNEDIEIGNQVIFNIFIDRNGDIWAGGRKGLYRISPDFRIEKMQAENGNDMQRMTSMMEDSQGNIWFTGSGIYRKLRDEHVIRQIQSDIQMHLIDIFNLVEFGKDEFYLLNSERIMLVKSRGDSLVIDTELDISRISGYLFPSEVLKIGDYIISGSDKGLCYISTTNHSVRFQKFGEENIQNSLIHVIHQLRVGQIWIVVGNNDIYSWDPETRNFRSVNFNIMESVPGAGLLYELFEWKPDQLLIRNQGKPQILDLKSGALYPFPSYNDYIRADWETYFTSFCEQGDRLWIGKGSSFVTFNRNINRYENWVDSFENSHLLPDMLVRDIFFDRRRNIWLAYWVHGIYRLDLNNRKVSGFEKLSTANGRCVFEDRSGRIWIGTRNGLFKYDYSTDSIVSYKHDPSDPESMSENTSFCIYEDTSGYIWSGSYGGGLNRLDPTTGKFIHFTTNEGLLNNTIFSLLPDNQGNVWMSSYDGISRFNPYTYQIDNYTHENGLLNKGFDAFLYGKSPFTGHLFFGGEQGIDYFHPDSIKPSAFKPPVVFTGFKLFNKEVPVKRDENPDRFVLNEHINFTKEIQLPYHQKVITLEYAALDYSGPAVIKYAYQLEGFDPEWQYVENKRDVTYTNLSPGKYLFKVKSSNADGIWNEDYTSLSLIITPPWWATWWSYTLYFFLISSIIYLIYRYQQKRWFLQTELKLKDQETVKLREIDALKSNLYTNITHEFRTPLTVISGLAGMIREKPKEWISRGTGLIEENSRQLLQMVNQILDLQKMEAGKMEINPVQEDVVEFLNYVTEPFGFLARQKGLEFSVTHTVPELWMDFDPEKLTNIVSNLCSNAIKFTNLGEIQVRSGKKENGHFSLEVQDTGKGIPGEHLPLIFDRFYQVEQGSTRHGEGTGIGLALVKELVERMGGTITVESREGAGSCFKVELPCTQVARRENLQDKSLAQSQPLVLPVLNQPQEPSQGEGPHLMIIEDNAGVRLYLKSLLQGQFRVTEVADGFAGMEKSRSLVPDLIICDIMMPGKDGYEVCAELHADEITSHIPVILLTARADLASRVEGYRQGAEVYLTKPFEPEELLAQIGMLLEQRRRMQEWYRQRMFGEPVGVTIHPVDPLLHRLERFVKDHLADDSLDTGRLCREMRLSRSQLHLKIKALTGYSTTIYVRKMRLAEARRLIKETNRTVAEIAYDVGFRDPNFFSRVYRQEYGEAPKEGRGRREL